MTAAADFAEATATALDPVLAPRGFPLQSADTHSPHKASVLFHCDGPQVASFLQGCPEWYVDELNTMYGGDIRCLDIWVTLDDGDRSFQGEWQSGTLTATVGRERMDRLDRARHGPLQAWLDALVEVLDVFFLHLERGGGKPDELRD